MIPTIQNLESRRLLTAVLAEGVLTVTGTSKKDDVTVTLSRDGDTITVKEKTQKNRFKKATTTSTEFAAADVTSLIVNAGAGNDSVSLRGGTKDSPFSLAALINGEAGNDRLSGAAGNDTINGGDGDDDLYGNVGTDLLSGDAGEDLLVGGADVDTLNGGADDDLLKSAGDDAIDILDGGADSGTTAADDGDQAIADDDDETLTNVLAADTSELFGPPSFGGYGFGPGFGGGHGHGGHH